jgi:hypothetical protein
MLYSADRTLGVLQASNTQTICFLFIYFYDKICVHVQAVYYERRPKVVVTLKMKFKITVDFETGKHTVIRNAEAGLCCYKYVLTDLKPRIQPKSRIF